MDLKGPSYTTPPPSTCTGTLYPHIVKLLSLEVITCCPLQTCFVSSLPCSQSFRGRQSRNRPVASQHLHSSHILQNVRHSQNPQLHPSQRPIHLHRHFQCLLPHSHPSTLPEIPHLLAQQPTVLIPSDDLRHQAGTTDFHESYLRGSYSRGSTKTTSLLQSTSTIGSSGTNLTPPSSKIQPKLPLS